MRFGWSRTLAMLAIMPVVFAMCLGHSGAGLGAPDPGIPEEEQSLVERSGEIFVGTIDIVAGVLVDADGDNSRTRYVVLIDESLKGKVRPQSMLVVEQSGAEGSFAEGDAGLTPGERYLLFTSYIPGERIYAITEPVAGNLWQPSGEDIDAWQDIVDETACPIDDVLWMDGVAYQRRDWNDDKRYLEREWVGASIATVERQDTAANACRSDIRDLTATSAPAGTAIQRIKGYEPAFRVALRLPDGHRYLFEAVRNDSAKTGADLLDIDGRVERVWAERWFACDDTSMCFADRVGTSTDEDIATIVDLVLESPVIANRIDLYDGVGKYLRLRFDLMDGSTVEIAASLTTGFTANGLELPVDGLQLMLWGEPL